MFKQKTMLICLAGTLISGCSMEEITSINKQISDGAQSLTNTLRGGNDSADSGGMPFMAAAQPKEKKTASKNYGIPVDVDTAAARLRRYYKFMTTEELNNIRNSQNSSRRWVASAMEEEHPVWAATPGSYYKMGNDWADNEHLELELEKNGSGSRLYITYSSPNPNHLTENYLTPLYEKVKGVAEGTVR